LRQALVQNRSLDRWFIHFSADNWWFSNPHSRQLRFPSWRRKGFGRKIINKVKSTFNISKKTKDGFYISSFVYLPVFKPGWYEKLNTLVIKGQLSISMRLLKIEKAVCFATLPSFASIIHSLKNSGVIEPVIYYYSDQYDRYREITDRQTIIEWDRILRNDADAIYCASEKILDNIPEENKRNKTVKVIDHQLEFDKFDYKKVVQKDLNINKPIIGYFSSLTDSNDWEIIRYVASRRPEWNFVFIGNKSIDLPHLGKMANVHFLGYVPYAELPSIDANFSVGIMFRKMTEWIKACSPLKLKEYLALGLPVVSVPIEEVVSKYSHYVEIAHDGPSFLAAIENALNKSCREIHRNFASQFSWVSVVDEISKDCDLGVEPL
jgi:glycosyltransferase involved in cell wall biosynthesis